MQVSRAERIAQDTLQGRPVQPVERRAELVPVPPRTGRDRDLATIAAVAVDERSGLGGDPRQGFAQAKVLDHPGRIGRERDRRADLTQLGRLFHDLGGDTTLPQQQGQRQAAYPGSHDHDWPRTGHGISSRRGRAGSARLCIVTGAGSGDLRRAYR